MDRQAIHVFLDACMQAKTVFNTLPALPEGLTVRHMRIIAAIGEKERQLKVSEVAEALHSTRPSITKLIKELFDRGYLIKQDDAQDRRLVYCALSPSGQQLYKLYIEKYQDVLAQVLGAVYSEEELLQASYVMLKSMALIRDIKEEDYGI
ncbi:MAG: MarR family transcriptional regulator [Intestinibaculum porci]|uniref:MarR family transcriptional regulator n=1 Tax=Intestinibaculum porci TaxID=2487118 RepID=UPI003EFD2A1E